MTRSEWICLIVLGLAGCTDAPCGLDDLVSCTDCSVRHAFATSTSNDAIVTSRGPVPTCATCAKVWSLDAQTATAAIDIGPRTEILQISGAPDGTLYIIADQAVAPNDSDIFPMATNRTLLALDSTGAVKWSAPIDRGTTVLAGTDGPFVLDGTDNVYRGVTAFDGAHVQRWTMAFPVGAGVGPDGHGGLWFSAGGFSNQGQAAVGEIRHVDATGAFVGDPAPVASNPASGDLQSWMSFVAFSPTADGGFVTGGWSEGSSLVFDGMTLDPPATTTVDHHGFVAAYDASAKLKWAHFVDSPGGGAVGGVAAVADGLVATTDFAGASGIAGIGDAEDTDVLVETWGASGMTGVVQIGGAGGQQARAPLAVDADGTVWASFLNLPATLTGPTGDPVAGSSELTIDGESFDGGMNHYVVAIRF